MIGKTNLSEKQLELMRVIIAGNGESAPADLDEITERVSYAPTKQAIQFSIRALLKHGLIEKLGTEKRRGRMRQVIQATSEAKALIAFGAGAVKAEVNANSVDPVFSGAEIDLTLLFP